MDRFFEIVICGNEEIIAEIVLPPDASPIVRYIVAAAFAGEAAAVIERYPWATRLTWHEDANYLRWRGGTHSRAGEIIGGQRYGYRGGLVVTHALNPPKWLRDLCDSAIVAGLAEAAKAAAGAKQEDLTRADICESAGDLETAESIRARWSGF